MNNNGFKWTDDDDNETFRDMPQEAELQPNNGMLANNQNGMYQPAVPAGAPANQVNTMIDPNAEFEAIQQVMEESEEDDDYTNVLNDARLRLEQGKLYEMVMNHDLFEGMEIDARAVKHVQKEIRRFAKERMEIMLGMRQESKASTGNGSFNDLEVTVLKRMAAMFTKGATEAPNANEIAAVAPKKTAISPIKPAQPAPQAPKPLAKQPVTKLPQKAAQPLQRQVVQVDNETVVVPQEEDVPLNKHPTQMSEVELAERNKRISERQSQRKALAPNRQPMPTYEQQESYYMMQGLNASPTVSRIVDAINKNKR